MREIKGYSKRKMKCNNTKRLLGVNQIKIPLF
jgi:hypothetical protein